MNNSPRTTSIHILDDDSLLHVFYLYRPFLLCEDEDDTAWIVCGNEGWVRGRWWYKLAHVCQRWRNLILGSASYLDVCLVCTYGTPVADMLAHSPLLPLVIEYFNEDRDITAGDEEGAILALEQRDRVRRIRLWLTGTNPQKHIVAMDEEYPILEFLVIVRPIEGNSATLIFPETLQAPHLRHLALQGFTLPIGSRLLTTAAGLVVLWLYMDHPSTYFHPNTLLQWPSLMPQLETLVVGFRFPVPSRDVERQLMHTLVRTTVTLPNLHDFRFRGVSAYLEALLHRFTAPHLEKLEIIFYNQRTFSVPCLLHFMNTAENLRFDRAEFEFDTMQVFVKVYPRGAEMRALAIVVKCWHLDWQVSSVAQISNSLSQMFSSVEHLILRREDHSLSSEEYNEVDRTEWRKLLRSFSNVKTLRIDGGLVEELSLCLQVGDGQLPLGLLPDLQELTYSGNGDAGDAFTSFIGARQNEGRPVTLDRRSPSPPHSVTSFETSSTTSGSSDAGSDLDT
jgi:hypothetical protein